MPVGLYIHVPFCVSKCPYCDFYSLPLQAHDDRLDRYTAAVERALAHWAGRLRTSADTLYFGGGTPSLLGGARLARLIETAARLFSLDGAEITLEANPADAEPGGAAPLHDTLRDFAAAGGNRLSLGMQSASGEELRLLGRRHGPEAVLHTVEAARKAGIDNISLDLMLGIEGQDESSLLRSVERCAALGAAQVSAYLLKIEEGTPFGQRRDSLHLPGEDETAALYLTACAALEERGYRQYEISNFARPGRVSRHNLKYWDARPYLGVGPAAHSCIGGRRFAYPRDLAAFLEGQNPEREDAGTIRDDSPEEYLLLRLRLTQGLDRKAFEDRFGRPVPNAWRERAAAMPDRLIVCDENGLRLTREGFLVSNAVLAELLRDA